MAGEITNPIRTVFDGPGRQREQCFESEDSAGLVVQLYKSLVSNGAPAFLLQVDFHAPPGITILFGPSGSGKTTILQCIAGLLRPESGVILVGGRVLFDARHGIDVNVPERLVGYVFQHLALFPHLTVQDNIGFGLSKLDPVERRRRVERALESFHIAHLLKRGTREISGGERQRVALARSLVIEPHVLLLDEPLSGLDARTKTKIMDDLRAWNTERRIPILYVTHSRREAFALGERVIVLEQGRVISQGTPQNVLEAPRHETVAQLAGFENIFDAMVTATHERQGTMTCRVVDSTVELEVPLGSQNVGAPVRIAVRSGDILLATELPHHVSARNILEGKLIALSQTGVLVTARVNCGVPVQVNLTPSASQSLGLAEGDPVWLIIKTYSCHLVSHSGAVAS